MHVARAAATATALDPSLQTLLGGHTATSETKELQGSSPKRPRDDDVDGDSNAGCIMSKNVIGASSDGGNGEDGPFFGGGKRQRSIVDLEAWGAAAEAATATGFTSDHVSWHFDEVNGGGKSPTARLTEHLELALGGSGRDDDSNSSAVPFRETEQRHDAEAGAGLAAITKSDLGLGAELSARLQVALQQCVAAGTLPDVDYPRPTVCRPSPKQRKMLAPDVEFTSPSPLAVAGVVRKRVVMVAGSGGSVTNGSNGGHENEETCSRSDGAVQWSPRNEEKDALPAITPEGAGQLLLGKLQLPEGIVGAHIAKGHLNFRTMSSSPSPSPHNDQCRLQQSVAAEGDGTAAPLSIAPRVGQPPSPSHPMPVSIPHAMPRNFELIMVPSSDPTLLATEFDLYKRYQVLHHGDDPATVTTSSFRRFLCDSPLMPAPASSYPPGCAPPSGFGSFHQQYWVDGRLVAVGVVDVLPSCLSSKYLFWEPELAPLSLGKLASLQEISWVKEASATCASLKYYYLGFYLHSCHRMRYKADFAPSDLLCPVRQCWVPIDRVRHVLASDAHPPALADVPGVLEGLEDDEYVVSIGDHVLGRHQGQGAAACLSRTTVEGNEEVGHVRLFISGGAGRGQMITFSALCTVGVLSEDMTTRMTKRLERWMALTGPAWRDMVYHL